MQVLSRFLSHFILLSLSRLCLFLVSDSMSVSVAPTGSQDIPKEIILSESDQYEEYTRSGKPLKGTIAAPAFAKSKWEEDGMCRSYTNLYCEILTRVQLHTSAIVVASSLTHSPAVFINNHTSVWGSWWENGKWGYACCHSLIKNSWCTGRAGIEASQSVLQEELAKVRLFMLCCTLCFFFCACVYILGCLSVRVRVLAPVLVLESVSVFNGRVCLCFLPDPPQEGEAQASAAAGADAERLSKEVSAAVKQFRAPSSSTRARLPFEKDEQPELDEEKAQRIFFCKSYLIIRRIHCVLR